MYTLVAEINVRVFLGKNLTGPYFTSDYFRTLFRSAGFVTAALGLIAELLVIYIRQIYMVFDILYGFEHFSHNVLSMVGCTFGRYGV